MIDKKLFLDKNRSVMFGTFENEEKFLDTIKKVRGVGADILDCYTPYPVHGIDKAMGLKRSLLPVGSFICGCLGFITAFSLQYYIMSWDWPMIIGAKPTIGVSWMPVLFEMSVLFTAFGTAILFFIRSKMLHGKLPSERIDFRQTDDRLIIAIATDNRAADRKQFSDLLFDGGAVEVKERTNHGYEDFSDVMVTRPGMMSPAN
jgi:hypothetical protein